MMTPRRFPPPWSVTEMQGAFRVDDANGQALGYFYFRDDDAVARQARVLTRDEARRMAANFARFPEMLRQGDANARQGSPIRVTPA